MVAIVAGAKLGLEGSSAFVLGSRGQLGSAALGSGPNSVYVNAASGNLVIRSADEILIGRGSDAAIEGVYNSLGPATDANGDNWRTSFAPSIYGLTGTINAAGSTLTRRDWDGSEVVYSYDTTRSAYVSKAGGGAYDTITFAGGIYTWTDGNSRRVETYSQSTGNIATGVDADGNQLTYTYTNGLCSRITTADGDYVNITWNGGSVTQLVTSYHVTGSTTATLTLVRYGYDASNRLSTVTVDLSPTDNSIADGKTYVTTYGYDGTSKRVNSIAQSDGSLLQIGYVLVGSDYRVQTLTQTAATGDTRVTSFAYDTTNRVTTITDAAGIATALSYDTSGQLTQIASAGLTRSFAYNANGDVISATDTGGKITAYNYDANGNLLQERDAAGNTIDRTYGAKNELLTEIHYLVPDPDGAGAGTASVPVTTRYAYDAENHLRFAVTPQGDVTEYQYNASGQLISTIRYTANAYDVSALAANVSIAEATLSSWAAALADRSTVERTDTTYDFRGNIATVTGYTVANSTGVGLTTSDYSRVTYVYDQFGQLLSRQTNASPASEVFVYDGLGRLIGSTDMAGGTTTIAYADATSTTTVTLANGGTRTSVYNLAGDLISVTEAGTGATSETTAYKYDKLGRLRATVDAAGSRDFAFYDDAGRKIGYMDKRGYITEYRYDAANRVIVTIIHELPLSAATIASLYDSNGNPTAVTLASVLPAATASDEWTWNIYDSADRLIETINGGGNAVVYGYDGDSRLVSTTRYANVIAAATVTGFKTTSPTALVLPAANAASDQLTRSFYDNDGRLIGTLDGEGALSRVVYDAAGRKIQVDAYANLTTAGLRASGTFAQLLASVGTNAADRHDYYVYDDRGDLRFTLDGNARPTEYVYDAVGNLLHTIDYGASITAASSYSLSYVQGQIGTLNLAANAATRVTRSAYDNAGRKVFDINAEGGVTAYAYDALGHVVKQTRYAAKYTTAGDQAAATLSAWATANLNAADRVTRNVYDGLERLVYEVDAAGYVTEHQYDVLDRVVKDIRYPATYTVADGVTQASLAAQIGTLPAAAVVTSYVYDFTGNIVDSYDGNGVRTHYSYNMINKAYSVIKAYGTSEAAETRYYYNAIGQLGSIVPPYGTYGSVAIVYTYDGVGNLKTIKDTRGNTTTRTYDNVGNMLTETVPLDNTTNAVTTREYDAFGNVVKLIDPKGNAGYFYYDNLDRLTLQVDAEGYATQTSYNIGDQPVSTRRYYVKPTGTGSVTTLPTLTTNAKDAITSFTRDKLDRLTGTTDAEGKTEGYTLNAFGDRISVTNKLGGVTTNAFDQRGLLIQETLPVGATRSDGTVQAANIVNKFSYDARGNRTQMIEASGLTEQRTTTYAYDKADRLISKTGDAVTVLNPATMATSSVTPVESYQYDKSGDLILTTDANGAKTYGYYDKRGRKIAAISATGMLSTWVYDQNDNATAARVYGDAVALPATAGGTPPAPVDASNYRETTCTYDKNNRQLTSTVTGVFTGSYSGGSFATATQAITSQNIYDAAGNVVQQVDANNNSLFSYYDKNGRKIAQVDQGKYLTTWTLDGEGNVLSETRYATVLAGPVTAATIPTPTADGVNDRTTSFTYDRNGRRLTETRLNVLASTVSGNSVATASTNATITYTYNGLGEVLSKTEATGDTTSYTYDLAGRQTLVTGPAFTDYTGATVQQQLATAYDGLNNVARTVQNGARTTVYAYGAGGRLSGTTDPAGFATSYYYDADGRLVATSYARLKSDGTSIQDGKSTAYDAAGRITAQRTFSYTGGAWAASGDTVEMFYNGYGDMVARGTNVGGSLANAQEFADYDKMGRVWRTNFNDGVTKAYVYDANGNATLLLQTTGAANLRSFADLNALFADASGAITQTISVYDARNKLTDTYQVRSDNAGANPVHAVQATASGQGTQSFNGNVTVGTSNVAANGVQAQTVSSAGVIGTRKSGSFTISGSTTTMHFGPPVSTDITTFGLTVDLGGMYLPSNGMDGKFHVIFTVNNDSGTVLNTNEVVIDSTVSGYDTTPSYGFRPYQFNGATNCNIFVYQEINQVGAGSILLGSANYRLGTQLSRSFNAVGQIGFKSESPNATALRMFVRPQGSAGAYVEYDAAQLVNSAGAGIAGWFKFDASQAPFNSFPAGSAWDVKYLAMDGAGNIYDAKQGTVSVDGSGNPSTSFSAMPVNGPGQAMFTTNGTNYLILSGLPSATQSVRMRYRAAGSNGAWTLFNAPSGVPGGGYGQTGFWAVGLPGFSGNYEYWIESFSGANGTGSLLGKSYGTFSTSGQPSALTGYSDVPEIVTFAPPSGATVTMQQFRYFANGVWSNWITNGAGGNWNYDASALVPDNFSSYSYPVQYETYNGTTLLSHTEATLTLGSGTQSVTGLINTANTPAKVVFVPQQGNATKIVLYWRDKGTTGAFSAVTIVQANGMFAWDVDAAGVRPSSGSRTLEYYYDAYDSSDNLLPTQNGADHAQGTIVIQSDKYVDTLDSEIRWVLDTKTASQFLIHRAQGYNAFGEISGETDGNGNATTLAYNTEGKLITKTGPAVAVTGEDGVTTTQNLVEQYYYDKSGRLVGARDANGNLVTQALLAGTGYGGSAATVLAEYRPASSTTQYGVDVFGDVRKVTDGLGKVTLNSYDAAGRLIEVDHPVRVGGNSPGVQLKDYYAYDGLGQRIKHWDSQLGASVVEATDYDAQGRVTSTRSFGGQVTGYAYSFLNGSTLPTTGLGAYGGWKTTITNAAGLTMFESKDIFGNLAARQDFGGHANSYQYDLAGHLVHQGGSTGQSVDYSYYANGYVKSITDNVLGMKSTFEYDNNGNRTLETYNSTDANPIFYQNAAITYDAANRITVFNDAKARISYKYDAVGNRRNINSVYHDGLNGAQQVQDYWYKYDSSNRFVLTMGQLSGGVISTGTTGVALSYDAAGNRATATYGSDGHGEAYSYTADGYLENMSIGGVVRAKRTYDAMGRVTAYSEYDTDGVTSVLSRTTTYDNDNRALTESGNSRVRNTADTGWDTVTSTQSYDYKAWNGSAYAGADQGVVTHIRNAQYTNGDTAHTVTTDTRFFYQWWDEAKQATIRVNGSDPSNPNSGSWAPGFSSLEYDVNGHVTKLTDSAAAGGARVVNYTSDAYGQVMVREQKNGGVLGPRQLYYYFNGNRIGDVGNDGPNPSQVDYAQTLARDTQGAKASKNGFRYGKPVASADFDENYQPVNAQYPGPAAALYTVRAGDTLRSIAQAAWGDSSLWYLIADANGLSGDSQLVAGQRLTLPNKVTNIHNNTGTFKVYDPGEAIGDTLPTLPPAPAPPRHHGGCGIIGQIMSVVVAVAASYFLGPILGNVVSQGFNNLTGMQHGFSWKSLGLSVVSAGVAQGLGGAFDGLGSATLASAAEAATANAITQGIGVVTGLQDKFDWTGVAAAGIGAGVGSAIGGSRFMRANFGRTGTQIVSNVAAGLANAAARSLINGTDFGDNIMAALPDVIGQTVGNLAADGIAGASNGSEAAQVASRGPQYASADRLPAGQMQDVDPYAYQGSDIVVTARKGHSLGWKIADFLGFHGSESSANRDYLTYRISAARPSSRAAIANAVTRINSSYPGGQAPWIPQRVNTSDSSVPTRWSSRDIAGKVNALPLSAAGLVVGVAADLQGLFTGNLVETKFDNNALQFTNVGLGVTAPFTLGNVQIYPTGYGPDTPTKGYSGTLSPALTRFHEEGHTYQEQAEGIAFVGRYLSQGLQDKNNPYEISADAYARGGSPYPTSVK